MWNLKLIFARWGDKFWKTEINLLAYVIQIVLQNIQRMCIDKKTFLNFPKFERVK